MTINAIILARGGSKGLPDKNILPFGDKPLVTWSVTQACDSKLIDNVYVSSDSLEILDVTQTWGAIPIIRPDNLSHDTATSESALKHALNMMGDTDIVVFLQPTSPLRTSEDIDNAITTLLNGKHDSLFSSVELEDLCIWGDKDGEFNSLNFDYQNRKRRQDIKKQYLENGSIYVFKPQVLIDYNNRLGGDIGTYVMDSWKQFEIDNEDDFDLCEYYLKKKLWKKD